MNKNMEKIIFSIIILGSVFMSKAQQQERLVYTLQDCIQRGLENNLGLQIVRNDEQTAHNNAT